MSIASKMLIFVLVILLEEFFYNASCPGENPAGQD